LRRIALGIEADQQDAQALAIGPQRGDGALQRFDDHRAGGVAVAVEHGDQQRRARHVVQREALAGGVGHRRGELVNGVGRDDRRR